MKTTMSELTAVLPAEKTVTTQSGGLPLILTKKSRSPVTVVLTVVSTSTSRWASAPDSLRRYRTHSHQNSPSTTATATSATPVGRRRLQTHPDCPDEGQFGVNVIAQSALSRYDHRLPYRKIADRFEQLHGLELSGASAWHATERAARAGRCEYEQIRREIQDADVVHIDETGIKRDGEQAWIWTFRTSQHTLYAVRESRGSDVPAEVLGEDFAGTVICDGWTVYPAFSSNLQRCWAHILREAKDAAEKQAEGEPIYRALTRLYVALQTRLESDLTVRERAELQRVARRELESLIEQSVPDGPVATLSSGRSKEVSTTGSPSSVSQRSPQRTTQLRTRFVNQSFSGKSSGHSVTIEACSSTRRSCPCWRRGASRDAIPTKNFAEWSAAMR